MKYQFSSFPEYLSDKAKPICQKEIILSNFKNLDKYQDFILNQADYQRSLDMIKHQIFDQNKTPFRERLG